jgi:DinB superfamily
MKRTIQTLLLSASLLLASPLTQHERDYAMSNLHATRKQILDVVSSLSDSQLNFKPGPNRWSIAQNLAYITASEGLIMDMLTGEILTSPAEAPSHPADPDRRYSQIYDDAANPESQEDFATAAVPPDKPANAAALIAAFKARRDRTIAFVDTTTADLHAHFKENPRLGRLDAYEWILFAAGHSERHYLQMKEIMTNPGFPKN